MGQEITLGNQQVFLLLLIEFRSKIVQFMKAHLSGDQLSCRTAIHLDPLLFSSLLEEAAHENALAALNA